MELPAELTHEIFKYLDENNLSNYANASNKTNKQIKSHLILLIKMQRFPQSFLNCHKAAEKIFDFHRKLLRTIPDSKYKMIQELAPSVIIRKLFNQSPSQFPGKFINYIHKVLVKHHQPEDNEWNKELKVEWVNLINNKSSNDSS